MKRWQYNCLIWHVAIFIRSTSPLRGSGSGGQSCALAFSPPPPILLTLHALIRLGNWAEEMEHRAENIPGLRP